MRIYLLIAALCIGFAIALTQHFALLNYWYWTYPWLDTVMHFFGGALIALLAAVYFSSRLRIVGLTLVVGVMWEVFEYTLGISQAEPNFISDTTVDLCMDLVGALCVYGMMRLWLPLASPFTAERVASPDQTSSSQ